MATRHMAVDAYGGYSIKHVNAATTTTQAVGALVDTTSTTAVAAPGAATITPASMVGIVLNMRLAITDGTGTAEIVTVTSVSATTFTATFANTHSGTYNIRSLRGTALGPVIFGQLGTSMSLTLYNGHPAVGGATLAVITPANAPFAFAALCDQGLFFAYTGTTAGDVSIHYQASDV